MLLCHLIPTVALQGAANGGRYHRAKALRAHQLILYGNLRTFLIKI